MSTDPKIVADESKRLEESIENGFTQEDVVTPWDVASSSSKGVDYEKLICKCEY